MFLCFFLLICVLLRIFICFEDTALPHKAGNKANPERTVSLLLVPPKNETEILMKNFEPYFTQLYYFASLPAFLYDAQENYLQAAPADVAPYRPTADCVHALFQLPEDASILCRHNNFYWGILKMDADGERVILGPIAQAVTAANLEKLLQEYVVTSEERSDYFRYFSSIPTLLPSEFRGLLRFIAMSMNPSADFAAEIEKEAPETMTATMEKVHADHQEGFYDQSEEEMLYSNQRVEDRLCAIIEEGDLTKLREFSRHGRSEARYGDISRDPIRQLKTTIVIATTLVSRAAIRGGLSPVFAYVTADLYMKKAEELWDEEGLYRLIQAMQQDFCQRVHDAKRALYTDSDMMRAIDFVHANLNKKILVSDVADAVGLSRSYLSRRFKQELGFSLNSFIRRCKLEESKSLLQYSDYSISHISEYLCFSSQSNYQNLFKSQYGMTPAQWRKESRR